MTDLRGQSRWCNKGVVGLVFMIASMGFSLPLTFAEEVLQEVAFLTRERELFAFSGVAGRWTTERLHLGERVLATSRAARVVLVVTNRRVLGFSAFTSTWKTQRLKAGESVVTLEARGAVGTALTNKRTFGFSARTSRWAVQRFP